MGCPLWAVPWQLHQQSTAISISSGNISTAGAQRVLGMQRQMLVGEEGDEIYAGMKKSTMVMVSVLGSGNDQPFP
jgi:hypothetical protein